MKLKHLLEEHWLFQGHWKVQCGFLQEANITTLAATSSSHQDMTESGWQHHLQQHLEYGSMIPAATLSLLRHFHSLPYFSSFIYCFLCLLANNQLRQSFFIICDPKNILKVIPRAVKRAACQILEQLLGICVSPDRLLEKKISAEDSILCDGIYSVFSHFVCGLHVVSLKE